jgi:hypothetical protein
MQTAICSYCDNRQTKSALKFDKLRGLLMMKQ